MKIDGMDAVQTNITRSNDSVSRTKEIPSDNEFTNEKSKNPNNFDSLVLSQMSPQDKKEMPVSEKVVIDAIEKANRAILGSNRRFEFSIHEKTKEIMVKVIDSDTNEIVREIPSEKTLDLVAKMWEMAGVMVDERR